MKIRTKLLLFILPVVLLVMLMAAWGGRLLVSEQAERQLLARAESVAILHDNRLERAVSQTLAHLRLLSRISQMDEFLASTDPLQQRLSLLPRLREVLSEMLDQLPRYSALVLLDGNGQERLHVTRSQDPFLRFEERYPELLAQLQQQDGSEVALYAVDQRLESARLWIGLRFSPDAAIDFMPANGQLLLAALELDEFNLALNDLLAREELALLVVDRRQQLVGAPLRLPQGLREQLLRRITNDVNAYAGGVTREQFGGRDYLVKAVVNGSDLRIFAVIDERRIGDVAAPLMATNVVIILSALVSLGVMVVVLFGRLVLRPLRSLQQQIDATAAGTAIELPQPAGDDEVSRLYAAYARMMGQLRSAQTTLRQAISTDPLTHVLSRRGLEDALRQQAQQGSHRCYALLHLGLDDFKLVNDMHGHGLGDRALVEFAQLLRQDSEGHCGHPSLCQLARISGDEFAVLLFGHDAASGEALARRVQVRLHQPLRLGELNLFLKCSIGIAASERGQLLDLNRRAALALEDAKISGKQVRRLYSDELEAQVRATQLIEEALKRAIVNDEMTLVFQPYLRASDGMIAGAEALLRWHSSTLGHVGPDRFIPVAEKSGLIIALDRWVVRNAISALARIRATHAPHFRLAVNISTRELQEPDFADFLAACLREHKVPAEALELELTETAITQVDNAFVLLAVRLHELGVALVLDDFGTGFTSLNHLSQLPISKLKIERQHVNQIGQQSYGVALVDVVVSLSKVFGFAVTAEGVETEQQWRYLSDLKVDYLQGYRFFRPMPRADLELLLRAPTHANAVNG